MRAAGLLALASWVAVPAAAKTVRIGNQGDVLSMDPHSLAEAVQLSFLGNVFEPLVTRDAQLKLMPALATRWTLVSPNLWRFELRRNVRFHDGSAFDAEDVIFSLDRARGEGSDMRTQTASIKTVRAPDPFTVEIETSAPNPILPELLTTVYMMDRQWAETQRAERPVDRRRGTENIASFQATAPAPTGCANASPMCAHGCNASPAGGASWRAMSTKSSSCRLPTTARAWPRWLRAKST